jgi:phosphoesterase RecJ-like protein
MIFNEQQYEEIAQLLNQSRKIAITTHRNPDGDAIGSTMALSMFLRQYGSAEVCVVLPDPCPHYLSFLTQKNNCIDFSANPTQSAHWLQTCDLLFCLDYNHPARTGPLEELLRLCASRVKSVMLDHHPQPEAFVNFMGSNTRASSTCELVYEFCTKLGMNAVPPAEIAACIYTGIMTDTGSFRFSVTTPNTHRIAENLLLSGIRHWEIHEALFNQNSLEKLRLWGIALKDRLEWLDEYKVAYIAMSANDLKANNYKEGDLEGLVNYALSISSARMGVLFSERDDKIRISFRSVGDYSANRFARTFFEGGGHENAAGGVYNGSLDNAVKHLINSLNEFNA